MPFFTAENGAFVVMLELVLSRLPVDDRSRDVSAHVGEMEGQV